MEIGERILEIINSNGPVIPSKIAKEIGTNILMASAHLAELSSSGKIKVSKLKIGGTPLYYLSGQEENLENFSSNLHEKERKAYDLLKNEKVLRDRGMEPVIRVALREIKDFAKPLQVKYQNTTEIFWKWHSTGQEEAKEKIGNFIRNAMPVKETIQTQNIKKEEEKQEQLEKPKEERGRQEYLTETSSKEKQITTNKNEEQTYKKGKTNTEDFLESIVNYFKKKNIKVLEKQVIKKGIDLDFVIRIPSIVGDLTYYCKARNKKRISDLDLSNAQIIGQSKQLPTIFLSSGELSKKASEILNKELTGMNFKQLDQNGRSIN